MPPRTRSSVWVSSPDAAAARDPEPGRVGPALERISVAIETAIPLVDDPELRWPALGLVHLSLSMAATELAIATA